MVTAPFSSLDLEAWRKLAQDYRSDPGTRAQNLRYLIKQHHPDRSDMQLLLESLPEAEKQPVLQRAALIHTAPQWASRPGGICPPAGTG